MELIDDLDTKLITMLRQDGRRSNAEIARRLGVAEGTVRQPAVFDRKIVCMSS